MNPERAPRRPNPATVTNCTAKPAPCPGTQPHGWPGRPRAGPAACGLLWLAAQAASAAAPPAEEGALPNGDSNQLRMVIGAGLAADVLRTSQRTQTLHLQPAWAVRYGRFRIGSGRASSLMGTDAGSGATALLVDDDRWKLSLGLRWDKGEDGKALDDRPPADPVRSTLRMRLAGSWRMDRDWTVSLSGSQDILGRDGGALLALELGRSLPAWGGGRWSASGGFNWGNAQFLRSHYGSLAAPGWSAYEPGSGVVDAHVGIGAIWPAGPRWLLWTQANAVWLMGPAAASPVTERRGGLQLQAGAAWRWR